MFTTWPLVELNSASVSRFISLLNALQAPRVLPMTKATSLSSSSPSPIPPFICLLQCHLANGASSPRHKSSLPMLPSRWLSALMTQTKLWEPSSKTPRTACWCFAIWSPLKCLCRFPLNNICHRHHIKPFASMEYIWRDIYPMPNHKHKKENSRQTLWQCNFCACLV